MSGDRHLGFVAAAATLLAAAPLSAIFDRWTWLVQCTIAVALIAGAALSARSLRLPIWGQVLAMLGALLFALTWIFPASGGLLALLPTPATLAHFVELAGASAQDMRTYGVPVEDTEPLLFISVLGIGAVAILVDVCVVGLRRPALAGLPMLAIYSVPVAVYPGSVPPAPFIIGTGGFLWLLVADNIERVRQFGRRFTGDGRGVDVWEPSPLAAAGRRLAVVGVVAAVLLPLAVPGMTSGPLSRLAGGNGNGNGKGGPGGGHGQIDLFATLAGQLTQSEVRDLVKVTTNDPRPFYLRFGVADELREDGFATRGPSGVPINQELPGPQAPGQRAGVTQQRFQATVEVTDGFDMPLLPVYAEPTVFRGLNTAWRYDPNLQILFSNRARSKGREFSFDFVRSSYTPAALDAAPSLPARDKLRQFIALPEPISEIDDIVEELTRGKSSDYDKVLGIYNHFSRENGFSYSLRTEEGTSGRMITDFLRNKAGYCQQYAAAMAWLVRAAGIPARVAFGFSNGSNRRGDTYTLTNLNLHAWTEVHFTGIGWVPFDATPATSVPGSTRTDWAPDADAPDPVAPPVVPSSGPGVDPTAGPGEVDRPDRNVDEGTEGLAGPGQQQAASVPWWSVTGVLLLLGLLTAPAVRRALLRRRRLSRPGRGAGEPAVTVLDGSVDVVTGQHEADRRDAHAAWDELVDTLLDYRLPVDPTRTPRAVTEELARRELTGDAAADAARLLGLAEERARYSRVPLGGEGLAGSLSTVRRALRDRADRRVRLVAAVLPPSVLLRWRAATVRLLTDLVTSGGRLRERMVRWSPRRILAGRVGH